MNKNKKNLCWTYFLWLIGGLFGLHHFYLGRFRHAFAFWISFGGYFGVGWFRDLWRIPDYVDEANENLVYIEKLIQIMRRQPKPSYGFVRCIASIIVADILGYLVMGAIPYELLNDNNLDETDENKNLFSRLLISVLVPFSCALGVHIVGNVGRYSGSIKWPLFLAYLTSPLYLLNYNAVFLTSLLSLVGFVRYSLKWRRTLADDKQNTCTRYVILILCVLLYCSLWTSWFYFNCSVTDKNDETIKCRDSLRNFFNSPIWLDFLTVLKRLLEFIKTEGLSGLWNEIVEALDPQGEKNAFKILGLNEESSQEEITAAYRKLARQWHPDKHKNQNDKREAQNQFMKIQEAYDLLSRMKQKRLKKQLA